jgi:hypothetical protein
MAIDFISPSQRAAGSDITIAISPLGLVELSDEEFEVHGPRLARYAQAWAFYLGHHWAYRREMGEPQLVFNYVKALSDFLTNFTFSKGVFFSCDKAFQHIVPALLDRIWTVDNNKEQLLWEIGNMGSVSGDAFVKIAYEPPYMNAVGKPQPGRVVILPINPSFAFPEWHPHAKNRLLRFKLKYRFWGTSLEGTRQVYTYVEIITDDTIQEFVNDELIDERPNPLGTIPVVHIANQIASASPWGLSDVLDVIPLNREYNEKATEISDIINYHTAPVTIITGGKPSNLEKGAKKVWALASKDAKVYNLEGGEEGLPNALLYLEKLKQAMHEMTGVPESALGQAQPISNTSGVALSIQFMPTTMKYELKKTQYGTGLRQINKIALMVIFTHEPETAMYNPNTDGIMQDDQAPMLDPNDPAVYNIDCMWPPPLPVDILIKLQEIQLKISMNLESKKGALRDLGEEFPDEKLQELFQELLEDAKQAGALEILRSHISAAVIQMTGVVPEGVTPAPNEPTTKSTTTTATGTKTTKETGPTNPVVPTPTLPGLGDIGAMIGAEGQNMMAELVTQAYGTKLPQQRDPDRDNT